jgi:glycerophosphoryl diester phosphodiesterase
MEIKSLNQTTTAPFPRVVAHRGLSGSCPENTLPAFAAAVALGADEIEFDLWASRDGELVVCHDPDVDRTSNGHGLIRDLSWAEIRVLDAGRLNGPAWAGIPFCRLEEVMELCGGRSVMNIHIKETGKDGLVVRRTMELASRHGLLKDIYIAGDRKALECASKQAPDIPRCCLEAWDSGARMMRITTIRHVPRNSRATARPMTHVAPAIKPARMLSVNGGSPCGEGKNGLTTIPMALQTNRTKMSTVTASFMIFLFSAQWMELSRAGRLSRARCAHRDEVPRGSSDCSAERWRLASARPTIRWSIAQLHPFSLAQRG